MARQPCSPISPTASLQVAAAIQASKDESLARTSRIAAPRHRRTHLRYPHYPPRETANNPRTDHPYTGTARASRYRGESFRTRPTWRRTSVLFLAGAESMADHFTSGHRL